ncbi:hypothetical protein PPYR_01388 [Photinus pyralis]|uniref:Uncharacterized protein n=3 Tax=Photinus pyralis TaxID=7054 RepID=A0A5N4B4F8_PHOPY|nr:hypothetical protein PPYR_01388 [Photinus pyralis]
MEITRGISKQYLPPARNTDKMDITRDWIENSFHLDAAVPLEPPKNTQTTNDNKSNSSPELGADVNIPEINDEIRIQSGCCELKSCDCSLISGTPSNTLTSEHSSPFCIDRRRSKTNKISPILTGDIDKSDTINPSFGTNNIVDTNLDTNTGTEFDILLGLSQCHSMQNNITPNTDHFNYISGDSILVTNNIVDINTGTEYDTLSASLQLHPIENNINTNTDQHKYISGDSDDSRDRDYVCESDLTSESSQSSATKDSENEVIDIMETEKENFIPRKSKEKIKDKAKSKNDHFSNTEAQSRVFNIDELIKQKRNVNDKKQVLCKYCKCKIATKNFARHLESHHRDENEVKKMLQYPRKSKERRQAFSLFRNHTNFDQYIEGVICPYRETIKKNSLTYYPCIYCKGVFQKEYLKRHSKLCVMQNSRKELSSNGRNYYITNSQTAIACAMDTTNVISRLNVKELVFSIMKGDEISLVAKKDLLIANFGESYLKKHKRERKEYACSSRMRELSRLLIAYREIVNDSKCCLKDILKPKNFDHFLAATRKITGYNPTNKLFKAPSLAMHLGTYLKDICDECTHLVLKESPGFTCQSESETELLLQEIKKFKKLLISRWNTEISSLANKDLQEKKWNKPLLVPLVNDIKIFREEVLKMAEDCVKKFVNHIDDIHTYKLLVQCSLSLLILFNRRRIGDVQYLKIQDYMRQNKSSMKDFESALTESEKALTAKYRRIVNSGKGSRQVVILLPETLEKYINVLLEHRKKYMLEKNEYVFAIPQSKIKWGQGDVAIRYLCSKIKLEYPEAISSNKLRKHIATVTQILNLSKEDIAQFSKFMGHTEKTHADFYELPVDIYQTAKVSKLLLMMEKGSLPTEFKGKTLSQIEFDENTEYAEENVEERAMPRKESIGSTSAATDFIDEGEKSKKDIASTSTASDFIDEGATPKKDLAPRSINLHHNRTCSVQDLDSDTDEQEPKKQKIQKRVGPHMK